MEMRPTGQNRLGILSHLAIQIIKAAVIGRHHRVTGANRDTAAAAHTLVVVNMGLALDHDRGIMGADLGTQAAAHAGFLAHQRLTCVVLLHLTGPAAAAHTDIFQRTAEAGLLMALKVVQ